MFDRIGRYEIQSELGRGGMATVYRGIDPSFQREVAIKVLPRELLHDPQFRGRFEREARTIAALEHPAIVPVYDFGEQDGQPYLVMRYMPGGSLADRLQHGPLALGEVARIFSQLAGALNEAHAMGLVHRDLKPNNILFDQRENAYIADFGIVKVSDASVAFTGTGIVGTPAYMSPEQARGMAEVDKRSDIYALGAILFEMLTGKLPYESDTPLGMAMAHISEPVPRILEVRADLPPQAEAVISKAMAKEADQRFASASALATAVSNLAGQQTVPDAAGAATMIEPEIGWQPTQVEPTPPTRVPLMPPAQPRRGLPKWAWVAGCAVLVSAVLLGVLAIGGGGALLMAGLATPTPVPSPTSPPTSVPPTAVELPTPTEATIVLGTTSVPVQRGTAIVLFNNGTVGVCGAYIAPTDETSWGENWLDVAVPPAGSMAFEVTPGVSYDLRADDCQGRNADESREVTLAADQQFRWSVFTGATGEAQVTLINNSASVVCFVNYSFSSADSWGADRLGTDATIAAGDQLVFEIPDIGEYDFRALDCDQNTLHEMFSVHVSAGQMLQWDVRP